MAQLDRRRRAGARPVEDGHPPVRRASTDRAAYTLARTIENYATYYDIHYPNEERQAGRPLRLSPTYDAPRRARRGVRREVRLGAPELVRAERAPRRRREALRPRGWAGEHWSPAIGAEALATRRDGRPVRRDVSFAKIEVVGPGALALPAAAVRQRRRPCRSGAIVYTQLLNRRGGIECDLTVTRLADGSLPDRHRTAVRQPRPRLDPPAPARRRRRCRCDDVTSARACFGAVGPAGARHPRRRSRATTSPNAAFPYLTAREITRRVACRCSPCGSPTSASSAGSCTAHTEYGLALWDTLWDAGAAHGHGRRRLPGDRRPAAREGLPRLVERHHPGRDAVRGRPRASRSRSTRTVEFIGRDALVGAPRPPVRASACAASSSTIRARSASATSRSGSAARSSAGSRPAATASPSSARSPTRTCRRRRAIGTRGEVEVFGEWVGFESRASRCTTRRGLG